MSNPFNHPKDSVLQMTTLPVIAAVVAIGPERVQWRKCKNFNHRTGWEETCWNLDGKPCSFSQLLEEHRRILTTSREPARLTRELQRA